MVFGVFRVQGKSCIETSPKRAPDLKTPADVNTGFVLSFVRLEFRKLKVLEKEMPRGKGIGASAL